MTLPMPSGEPYKPKHYVLYRPPIQHLAKIGKKLKPTPTRNFKEKIYADWRRKVRRRDLAMCRWPGCSRRDVVCHHIKRWADSPTLRFSVSNGICLCKKHHRLVTGKEAQYAPFLMGIVAKKRGDLE